MDELSLMYESIIISEMNRKVVDYVEEHQEDLPFNHIFGDNMRIFVPLVTDDVAQEILNSVKNIKDFASVDLKKGEVVRKIKSDPKYGRGDSEQRLKMGKAINSLKIDEDTKKKFLNWYAKYKDNLETAFQNSEYVVLISRAPVDVVRMSDHNNISSCHSRGHSHFHCAVMEAISGGAIAYLVPYTAKEKYDNTSELQDADLLSDDDREVGSIRPISRLRIRRISSVDDTHELALPEKRIYGNTTIPGFYNSVDNFLKEKQSNYIDKDTYTSTNWYLKGGSYADNDVSGLVRHYFRDQDLEEVERHPHDSERERELEYADSDYAEEDNREEEMREELEGYDDRYNFDYCRAGFSIDDDGDGNPYFTGWGSAILDLSDMNLPVNIDFEIDDSYDMRKTIKGEFDKPNHPKWRFLAGYISTFDIIKGFNLSSDTLELTFDDEDVNGDPETYYIFLDNINDFDNNVDSFLIGLKDVLYDAEVLTRTAARSNFSRLKEWEASEYQTHTNFEIIGDNKREYKLKFDKIMLLPIKRGVDIPDQTITFPDLAPIFNRAFYTIMGDTFKYFTNTQDDDQMKFSSFFENYTDVMGDLEFIYPDKISLVVNYNSDIAFGQEWFYMKPLSWDDKMFAALDNLDDIYPHILNTLRLYICHFLLQNYPEDAPKYIPTNYKNLKIMYKKYL